MGLFCHLHPVYWPGWGTRQHSCPWLILFQFVRGWEQEWQPSQNKTTNKTRLTSNLRRSYWLCWDERRAPPLPDMNKFKTTILQWHWLHSHGDATAIHSSQNLFIGKLEILTTLDLIPFSSLIHFSFPPAPCCFCEFSRLKVLHRRTIQYFIQCYSQSS